MGFVKIFPTMIKSSHYLLVPKIIADIAGVSEKTSFLIKINYGSRSPKITIIQQKSTQKKRRRRR